MYVVLCFNFVDFVFVGLFSLQWGNTPTNEFPVYDTTQSDDEVPLTLLPSGPDW